MEGVVVNVCSSDLFKSKRAASCLSKRATRFCSNMFILFVTSHDCAVSQLFFTSLSVCSSQNKNSQSSPTKFLSLCPHVLCVSCCRPWLFLFLIVVVQDLSFCKCRWNLCIIRDVSRSLPGFATKVSQYVKWFMLSCCWDLVDGTLADEDANSKIWVVMGWLLVVTSGYEWLWVVMGW